MLVKQLVMHNLNVLGVLTSSKDSNSENFDCKQNKNKIIFNGFFFFFKLPEVSFSIKNSKNWFNFF